jgi:D-alanine--poly(phosphoribitol) ligase subunit 1
MEDDGFLQKILHQLENSRETGAFFIAGTWFTYGQLSALVSKIQDLLGSGAGRTDHVGVYLSDDLQTYASILALWFSGRAFIPVNPLFPASRNREIMVRTGMEVLLASREPDPEQLIPGCRVLDTGGRDIDAGRSPVLERYDPERDAYVLFTSGSTGLPKGVRISFGNLEAFIQAFSGHPSYSFGPGDRFLQIYDLSFDGSLPCYVVPLTLGASVFTVPQDGIRYLAAYKLMREHGLTFIKMPPSTLSFLRPYFPEIRLPEVRYCLLGGEPFPVQLAEEFEPCIPNALIQNVYGPTECTVISSLYDWNGNKSRRKSLNGTVSIGSPTGTNLALVLAGNGQEAGPGQAGELLLAGEQLSAGYWKDPELTQRAYVERRHQGRIFRFYRTGDLVSLDAEGDLMFLGRNDEQVQVRGYRVELGEIEEAAREYLGGQAVMALGVQDEEGPLSLCLVLEEGRTADRSSPAADPDSLKRYLRDRLPPYMVPERILLVSQLPRLSSGKLDRKAVRELCQNQPI